MKAGILVFSRMSSKRLPGKAMMELGGVPLVQRVLVRASRCGLPVVLATSTEKEDDFLAGFANSLGFPVHRGSLNNVLERGVEAAVSMEWNVFFRLCGDRPFFDFDTIRDITRQFILPFEKPDFDLVTTLSSNLPKGLTTELINTYSLKKILHRSDLEDVHREHLTSFLYEYKSAFTIRYLIKKFELTEGICLAVDSLRDFESLSAICQIDSDIFLPTSKAVRLLKNHLQSV